MTWKQRVGLLAWSGVFLAHRVALASTLARGKAPLQNMCADFYEAGLGTYIPALALLILVLFVLNWNFGWVTIGEGLGKLILSIAILGGGVGLFLGWTGGNIAEGATLLAPLVLGP